MRLRLLRLLHLLRTQRDRLRGLLVLTHQLLLHQLYALRVCSLLLHHCLLLLLHCLLHRDERSADLSGVCSHDEYVIERQENCTETVEGR